MAAMELGFEEPQAPFAPAPCAGDDDRLARLRLIRSRRVGPATYRRLIAAHGSAAAALTALPQIARDAGVADYAPCPEGVALAEMKAARRSTAVLLTDGDRGYPAALQGLADAPPVLWALGNPALTARPAVALIGTPNASSLGARIAQKLSADLSAAGYVVVSGLARGIDSIAHQAALDGGTIAVMAGGVDVIYPAESADLARRIAREGLRLSEQPPGLEPQARHFPRRNRIVSGLARAVVVVEAAARSGSLITARTALDQGREVMAVPGHPLDARASGCNLLLRDGALLVRHADDVLEALGAPPQPVADLPAPKPRRSVRAIFRSGQREAPGIGATGRQAPPGEAAASDPRWRQGRTTPPRAADHDSERRATIDPERDRAGEPLVETERAAHPPATPHEAILARLSPSPVSEDGLCRDLGWPAADFASALAELEVTGQVERRAGGQVALIL